MHLTVTVSGGVGGLSLPPVTVDTSNLPGEAVKQIEHLLACAAFFDLPRTIVASNPKPDRLHYTLHAEHTVTCDEEVASEAFLDLVRTVQKAAKK